MKFKLEDFLLDKPQYFKAREHSDDYYTSEYTRMLIDDFSNVYQWVKKMLESSSKNNFFHEYDLTEDIIKIMTMTLLNGTSYIELHKLEAHSLYKIFIINYQYNFSLTNTSFFLVRNSNNKKLIYQINKKYIRKIQITATGLTSNDVKKSLKNLVKLSNEKMKLYNHIEPDFQKKIEKIDYKRLKYTKKIYWNMRGLFVPLEGQNQSYALYREIEFSLLKARLFQEIVIQINTLFTQHKEEFFLNTELIELAIIELKNCKDQLCENRSSNEEILKKVLSILGN